MNTFSSGFLIVRTFEAIYRSFSHRTPEGTSIYALPQEGIPAAAVAKKYRGLDREPLDGLTLDRMGALLRRDPTIVPIAERAAALAINALQNDGRANRSVLRSVQDAVNVYLTLGEPEDWEMIWVRSSDAKVDPPAQTTALGVEPSFFPWGSFSAVCDCMCFPRWHGTDEKGTLFADHYARLNGHGLFDLSQDAVDFLQFYRSHDWTESGEYSIIEVYALSDAFYGYLRTPVRYVILDAANRGEPIAGGLAGMTWAIQLQRLPKDRKIAGIKALRDITDMGLADAKSLVEALPQAIAVVHLGEVEHLEQKLAEGGFDFRIAPLG